MKEKYELAYEDYKAGMKYKDIGEKYDVSISTVKSWKTRYKWLKSMRTKKEKVRVQNEKSTHTKSSHNDVENDKKELIKLIEQDTELNDKQRLFCLYYLKNFNATQAAINAGYTENYPSEIGYQLLQKTTVRAEIKRLKKLKAATIFADQNDIVERYMKTAFADMTDFIEIYEEQQPVIVGGKMITTKDICTGEQIPLTKSVNVVRVKDSSMIDGGLIAEVSQSKDGVKIKLTDRQKALDWLAQYFVLNPLDKHKIEYDNRKMELEIAKISGDADGSSIDEWVGGVLEQDDING